MYYIYINTYKYMQSIIRMTFNIYKLLAQVSKNCTQQR